MIMRKLPLVLVCLALISLLSCEKQLAIVNEVTNKEKTNNGDKAEQYAKMAKKEYTVEEFEVELNLRLNRSGKKINSSDVTYNQLQTVDVAVPDLEVHIQFG